MFSALERPGVGTRGLRLIRAEPAEAEDTLQELLTLSNLGGGPRCRHKLRLEILRFLQQVRLDERRPAMMTDRRLALESATLRRRF